MSDPRTLFDVLGDETWRLYVDLDSQEHGPSAYDRGLGKGSREPGYLASMANAHRYVRDTLAQPLGIAFFEELHRITLAHAPPTETYRVGRSSVGIHRDRLEPGIEGVWRDHGAVLEEKDGKLRLHFETRTADVFRGLLAMAIERLAASLSASAGVAERLFAIATFHQSLELWHPTRDGNTRRHALVLAKVLVTAGLTPAIVTEINDVYVRQPESWARMLAQGMDRWSVIRRAITDGEDVEEAMVAFDRRGALGRRGARWLRPNCVVYAEMEHTPFGDE